MQKAINHKSVRMWDSYGFHCQCSWYWNSVSISKCLMFINIILSKLLKAQKNFLLESHVEIAISTTAVESFFVFITLNAKDLFDVANFSKSILFGIFQSDNDCYVYAIQTLEQSWWNVWIEWKFDNGLVCYRILIYILSMFSNR